VGDFLPQEMLVSDFFILRGNTVADCSDASDAEFEDDDVLNIKEVSDLLNFIKKKIMFY